MNLLRLLLVLSSLLFGAWIHGVGGSSIPVINTPATGSLYTYSPSSTSQAVGTLSASNTPTSWSITGGNSAGNFAIDNSGNITITSAGQSNLTGLSDEVDFTLTITASNGAGTSSGKSIPIAVYADGFANAPTCTVQNASLLNGYHASGGSAARAKGNGYQPQWNIPGVDYCAGLPSAVVLSDPAPGGVIAAGLSGVGCSLASNMITCSTASATIGNCSGNTGWDFSLHNGIKLVLTGAGITVQCNNFGMGSNALDTIIVQANNAVIQFNNINQGGVAGFDAAIYQSSGSGITIKYNYIHDAGSDFISINSGTSTVKYNYMACNGEQAGSHPDFIQHVGGATTTDIVVFNTWAQNCSGIIVGAQGDTLGDNSVQIVGTNNEFSYNTLLAISGTANPVITAWIRVFLPGLNATAAVALQNNFADISDATFFAYPGSSNGQTTWANNINMKTGAAFSNSP